MIEIWQFAAGTGLAQGTDVICNTVGVVAGGCSLLFGIVIKTLVKRKFSDEK